MFKQLLHECNNYAVTISDACARLVPLTLYTYKSKNSEVLFMKNRTNVPVLDASHEKLAKQGRQMLVFTARRPCCKRHTCKL